MKVIVGLGNPGSQYEETRHNIGFKCVDYFSNKHNIKISRLKFKSQIGEGFINGEKVLIVKPTTFMNNSGIALREIRDYYDLTPHDFIVVVDDVAIEFGEIRIKRKGSAGGHNGLKSIIYHLESDEFPRVKLGVGKTTGEELTNFVLDRFNSAQRKTMEELIEVAGDAIELIISSDIDHAMQEYNGRIV